MKKLLSLATILALSVSSSAMAGFQATNSANDANTVGTQASITTVAQAKKAHENARVSLTGKITKQIDHDEFLFQDSTGEIKIEVEDHAWSGQNITPNDKITIQGEVDNDNGFRSIEVYQIRKH